jgi:hypothetical protein
MSRSSLPSSVFSTVLWAVPRSGALCEIPARGRFIVAFPQSALVGGSVVQWLLSSGCQVFHSALVPGGSAFLLSVPPVLVPAFRRLRSGGGGSRHPSNALPF